MTAIDVLLPVLVAIWTPHTSVGCFRVESPLVPLTTSRVEKVRVQTSIMPSADEGQIHARGHSLWSRDRSWRTAE
jgi:hypothetical protein